LISKGYFYLIAAYLSKHLNHRGKKFSAEMYVREILEFFEYNYYYPDVTLDALANNLMINKRYISSLFKDKLGISPMQYLKNFRLDDAAQRLIKYPDQNVEEIAGTVGFKDSLYFSREFKKKFGVPPGRYRIK